MANPWFPPPDPLPDPRSRTPGQVAWVRGTGGQVVAGVVLDVLPWVLLIVLVALDAPRGVLLVSGALVAVAAVSLAVGAANTRSLMMRLLDWPEPGLGAPTDLRAAWVELFVPLIILLVQFMFPAGTADPAPAVAVIAAAEAGLSAVLLVTTGASVGRRLLHQLEKL